jgi:hypothetical protein
MYFLAAVKFKKMFNLFKQNYTALHNGKKVKEGDSVSFIDSDGRKHQDIIRRRDSDCIHADSGSALKKGTLYFWNSSFNPCDYKSADKLPQNI